MPLFAVQSFRPVQCFERPATIEGINVRDWVALKVNAISDDSQAIMALGKCPRNMQHKIVTMKEKPVTILAKVVAQVMQDVNTAAEGAPTRMSEVGQGTNRWNDAANREGINQNQEQPSYSSKCRRRGRVSKPVMVSTRVRGDEAR